MSLFADDFVATAAPDLFGYLGRSVVYVPKGQVGVTRQAIIHGLPYRTTTSADGTGTIMECEISMYADATNGIAVPAAEDTVEFDSTTWCVVEKPFREEGGLWRMKLVCYQRVSTGQPKSVIDRR